MPFRGLFLRSRSSLTPTTPLRYRLYSCPVWHLSLCSQAHRLLRAGQERHPYPGTYHVRYGAKAFALTTLIFHMLHVPVWYECLLQPHCSPDDEVPEGTSYSRHPVPFAESVLFSFILFLLPFLSRVFPKASCFPRFCCPYPIWEPLFFDGKFIRVSGNERVPAKSLCPEKNNDVVCDFPNIFFVQNFSNSTFPEKIMP